MSQAPLVQGKKKKEKYFIFPCFSLFICLFTTYIIECADTEQGEGHKYRGPEEVYISEEMAGE